MELVPTNSDEQSEQSQGRAASRAEGAERLKKLIERKKSEKRRLLDESAQCSVRLAELRALRRARLQPLDLEIHAHFDKAMSDAALDGAVRDEISELYDNLMFREVISPRGVDADEIADGEACNCQACRRRREQRASSPDVDPGERPETDVASARRVESPGLRDLYRGLATRFHPDKATTEDARLANEELMREINQAYASGDLTTLAALSREVGFEIAGDGVLEALAAEYGRIKADVRRLRREPLGELVIECRRCRRDCMQTPLDEIAEDIGHEAAILESLATVFRRRDSGVSTIEQFVEELLGSDEPDVLDDDAGFLEIIASMIENARARDRNRPPSFRTRKKARAKRQMRKMATKARRR